MLATGVLFVQVWAGDSLVTLIKHFLSAQNHKVPSSLELT